jgi:4-amino-4-deoxy-L-arabinose transferase-like glycosyltransferase
MIHASPQQNPAGAPNIWLYLALLMSVQALCWILAPILTNDAPPLDVVENTVWGAERVLATYKNPALAYLLIEASRVLTGAVGWPAYVLSQIAICSTFLCVFLLGRPVLGDARAFAGTALLAACYYFGWHTPEFNQDIVEMPFWAAVALALWRAVETKKLVWWIGLGIFAAGAIYGKLSAGILLLSAALWLLIDARGRQSLRTVGPWIALATFLVLFAPLAIELAHGGLARIADYAVHRGFKKFSGLQFIGLQIVMVLPMLAVLWLSGLFAWPGAERQNTGTRERDFEFERFTRYLLWMTLAPIALTAITVTAVRTGTKLMWGVPMLNLSGLILVSLAGRDASAFNARALRRLVQCAIVIIVATSMGTALTTRYGNQFRKKPDRQNWPQAEISARLRQIWQTETGAPLRIVTGTSMNWVAGLVALDEGDVAHIFTSANYRKSPWITPDQVTRDGTLVVWQGQGIKAPPELAKAIGGRAPRYETFALRHPGKTRAVTIGYVVVPPSR